MWMCGSRLGAMGGPHPEGSTGIVIVTHDPAQARRLAEWTVSIEEGGTIRQGPAAEVLA